MTPFCCQWSPLPFYIKHDTIFHRECYSKIFAPKQKIWIFGYNKISRNYTFKKYEFRDKIFCYNKISQPMLHFWLCKQEPYIKHDTIFHRECYSKSFAPKQKYIVEKSFSYLWWYKFVVNHPSIFVQEDIFLSLSFFA